MKKQSWSLYLLFILGIVFTLTFNVYAEEEPKSDINSKEPIAQSELKLSYENLTLIDCPEDLSEFEPTQVVMQVINNTFHKWREYVNKDSDELCIIMEEPKYRRLTSEDAGKLLEGSRTWIEQVPVPDKGHIISPENMPQIFYDDNFYRDTIESQLDESVED